MTRGPLALTLALLLVAPANATSSEPAGGATCILPTPAPKGSVRATLHTSGEREGAAGFWISDATMQRAELRLTTCIDLAAKCGVDLAVEKGKAWKPGWKSWVIGIGTAITIGYVGGRLTR